jgi:hypothetical protein
MYDENFGSVRIYFKKITDAPITDDRSLEIFSDLTYISSNNSIQHVEINFPKDGFSFIASADRNIGRARRNYNMFDNDGYWIGVQINLPKTDIEKIRAYCEQCERESTYDFSSLYCILCDKLSGRFKKPNTHSCASLTFNALLQSQYFRLLINEHVYRGDRMRLIRESHSPDPMYIYRAFEKILKVEFEDPIVEEIKETYIYNHETLLDYEKQHNYVKSNDEFFIVKTEGDQEESEAHAALFAPERWCLSFLE